MMSSSARFSRSVNLDYRGEKANRQRKQTGMKHHYQRFLIPENAGSIIGCQTPVNREPNNGS